MILVIDQPSVGEYMDYSSSLATYVVGEFYHVAYTFYLSTVDHLGYNPDYDYVHGLLSGQLTEVLEDYNVYNPFEDWVCTCETIREQKVCDGSKEMSEVNEAIFDMFSAMLKDFQYTDELLNAYVENPKLNFYVHGWDIVFADDTRQHITDRKESKGLINLPVKETTVSVQANLMRMVQNNY